MTDQLKVAVERAVRPVEASTARKLQFREELLSHIHAIHAEESATGGTDDEILQRTLSRFGPPEEITSELRTGLTWQDRVGAWFARHDKRRPGESPLRFALRISLMMLFWVGICFSFVALTKIVFSGRHNVATGLVVVPMLVMMLVVDTFVISWLGARASDRSRNTGVACWRSPKTWLSALIAGLAVGVTGVSVLWAASHQVSLDLLTLRWWLILAIATVFMYIGVVELTWREARRVYEWELLDLEPVG